ncbi:MAG: LysM peptidoglycan-binding domain-containing protein [Gloeobacteraceae cyanobacterium ES-bin-144]|nr:LysM peptidoglycan-binding domain-containing protein [Verrucomicrobiales bacterium]
MKAFIWLPSLCALFFILPGCSNNPPPGTTGAGPFDSRGNYVEAWADDPSKWRKPGSSRPTPSDEAPVIAKNEQPPANASPLPPAQSTKPAPVKTSPPVRPKSNNEVVVKEYVTPPEVNSKSKPKATTAKPKPVVVKAKPKPKSTRYTVKKGDTLSGIASRYGSSVSAIRSSNGISGNLIRPGQSLVIPKR